ncbi:hypothetical protein [Fusobacterium periodonticum]|uniref:hypothetical protein n=1 Tax=Fusobacterium periodonticum TaxID=860 RepID=UPI00195E6819|nr:hypothetical protein [Fusobacterium periodonticum]VTX87334.1 Uncharacterised protein [Fusobacterium periodonticum]
MKIKNFFHIILLLLIIFFLSKIPRYENTLLQLNKNTKIERDYSIFNDDEALLILDSANLEYNLYIKELKKIDNIWVGNAYSYKEAYEKNSGFKWLEDDSKSFNPEYNREQKEIEYNKSTAYFIIDDKKEVYGLSEDKIKEMLNISSLKLENPEKYIKKNGERARLTQFSQDLFRKMLNISDYYDSDKFEKENTTTANIVNKLIFLRNIMLIYLGINLILCIISLFKKYKNIKNLEKYMKVKEKRIWILYGLDFLTLFIYCAFTLFTDLEKVIELEKFIFYYIVVKNFLLYYYLKLSKKKFRKLVMINYLVLILISISVRNIRINIIFYYLLYFFSLLYLPIKQKLKRIVLVEPLYLITQILYLAIVYLWLYRLM